MTEASPAKAAAAEAQATHRKIAQSANVLEATAVEQTDSADRRTELAADRTVLAAERTYAAWVRTGLAALAAGVGARALLKDVVADWLSISAGVVLVLFSAACFVIAVWREFNPHVAPPRPQAKRLPRGLLFTLNSFLTLVALAAAIGLVASA